MDIHSRSVKYSSRYALMREARRIFQKSGATGIETWVRSLPYEEKEKLAKQIILIISHKTGRPSSEVALELLKGKGSIQ